MLVMAMKLVIWIIDTVLSVHFVACFHASRQSPTSLVHSGKVEVPSPIVSGPDLWHSGVKRLNHVFWKCMHSLLCAELNKPPISPCWDHHMWLNFIEGFSGQSLKQHFKPQISHATELLQNKLQCGDRVLYQPEDVYNDETTMAVTVMIIIRNIVIKHLHMFFLTQEISLSFHWKIQLGYVD